MWFMHRRPARLLLVAYLGFVGLVTLFPTGLGQLDANLVPLAGILGAFEDGGVAFGIWQLIGNLLLLAPVGVLLPAARPGMRPRAVVAVALAISVGIELAQWLLPTGRMADIDDVWLNVLGVAAGGAVRLQCR
jgi:glycopeptide antibiotics resistance protein